MKQFAISRSNARDGSQVVQFAVSRSNARDGSQVVPAYKTSCLLKVKKYEFACQLSEFENRSSSWKNS